MASSVNSKRSKRRAVVAALVVGAAVAGTGLWTVRKMQIRQQHAALRVEGLAAAREGRSAEATEKLWAFLQRDPDDKEVLEVFATARMATPLPGNRHLADAMRSYRRLVLLSPDRLDMKLKLVDLLSRTRSFTELLDLSDEVLTAKPGQVEALRGRTLALEGLRRLPEAEKAADEWMKVSPEDTEAMGVLFRVLLSQPSGGERAMARVDRMVAERPGDVRAAMMRSGVLAGVGRFEEARELSRRLVPRVAGDEALTIRLATQLDELGMSADTGTMLEAELARSGSAAVRLRLARRALEGGKMADAKRLASEGRTDATREEMELIAAIAEYLAKGDAKAEAPKLGSEAWSAVASAMLNLTGGGEERLKASLESVRQLAVAGETGPYPWFAAGAYAAMLGESDQATEYLSRTARMSPSWALPLRMAADLSLKAGARQRAKQQAALAVLRRPDEVANYLTLCQVMYDEVRSGGEGGNAELLSLVTDIQRSIPGEPSTVLMQIDLLGRAGRTEDARRVVTNTVLKAEAATEQVLLGSAFLSRAHGLGVERELLELSEKRFGRTSQWRFLSAAAVAQAGKPEDGLALIEQGITASQGSERVQLMRMAAQYAEASGLESAALWKRAIEAAPTDESLLVDATQSSGLAADAAALEDAIVKLRSVEGEQGVNWRVARARMLLSRAEDQDRAATDAVALLSEVIGRGTPTADVHSLTARAMQRLGSVTNAITQMETAVKLAPRSTRDRVYLATLLQSRRDFEGARRQIEAAMAIDGSPQMKAVAAELLSTQGDVGKAIRLIETLPNRDRRADLMLAELYERAGQIGRAKAVSENLVSDPDVRSVMLAVRIAQAEGKDQEAKDALAKLDRLGLAATEQKMLRAQSFAQTGDAANAMKLLDELVAEDPKFVRAYRLKVGLQLGAGDVAAAVTTAERAWGLGVRDPLLRSIVDRQQEMQLLFARGLVPLAMELLARPDDARVMRTTDAVLKADPLAVSASVGRISAISAEVTGDYPLQHAVVRSMAFLGRTAEASKLASNLALATPESVDAARLWVEVEAGRGTDGNLVESLAWLRSRPAAGVGAEQLGPSYAAALRRAGRAAEALQLAESAIATPGAARLFWRLEFGLATYQLGRGAEFDRRFAGWAKEDPTFALQWATAMGNELSGDAVMAWLGKLSRDNSVPEVDLAFVADAAAQRTKHPGVTGWAQAKFAEFLASPATLKPTVLLNIGVRQEALNDIATAERIYRSLIGDEVVGVVAKNNLSVLLAKAGKGEEAVRLASQVVDANPGQASFYDTLAGAFEAYGRNREALESITKATRAEPGAPAWRLRMAKLLRATGDVRGAAQQLGEVEAQLADRPSLKAGLEAEAAALRSQLAEGSR